jgi:hypothetical protein
MDFKISKLCTPAKIYFAIAVLSIIFALFSGFSIMYAFWKFIFALIWTFILGYLCKKGFKTISWILVLLPYIVIILVMLRLYRVTSAHKQFFKTIQLQGAIGQEPMTNKHKNKNH